MNQKTATYAPELIVSDRLNYHPESGDLFDKESGQCIGQLKTAGTTIKNIEVFWGKGGLMAVLISKDGVIYFGLPGSTIEVEGTMLSLHGEGLDKGTAYQSIQHPTVKPITTVQNETSQAMILGAGLATRFERISGQSTDYSKPAVPLMGRYSVIACLARHLALHGYKRLLINTYFKPESLKASLAACSNEGPAPEDIAYIDEAEPSGTAGALRKLLTEKEYAGWLNLEKPLLVIQGDSVTDGDFSGLMAAHVQNKALVTMGCQLVADEDADKFGILVTDKSGDDGQSGRIIGFQEKPALAEAKSRLGNTGFYIFSPKAFPLIQEIYQEKQKESGTTQKELELDFAQDVFPGLLRKIEQDPQLGIFWAQQMDCYWSDIGNPRQYISSVRDIYSGKLGVALPENPEQYYHQGVIYWHGAQAAAQAESAQLKGNVVVALRFQK
jgi:NDP-sugar pyrophosphorylase family protein